MTIGARAFANTETAVIFFLGNVTSIGYEAFKGCTSLKSVYVYRTASQGITTLGNNAFNGCPLTLIKVTTESIDAYKQAANWSNYVSLFQGGLIV